MIINLAKKLKRRIRPVANKQFDISSVPDEYKPVVRKIIANSPIWGSHQTIDFPNGFVLKGGRDQSRLDQFDLPQDLSGCSVLDIGCNIGGVSLECKKRQASRVMGLDMSPSLLECAKELSQIWDLPIDYGTRNIATDDIDGEFDYVFFLNVFHHLDDIGKIRALRTVDRITKKRLFFEAPVADDIVAGEKKWMTVDDYLGYFRGFTSFTNVQHSGTTDFGRPLITCDR